MGGVNYIMKLTETQKKQIEEELAAFTNEYAGKTKEERKAKGYEFETKEEKENIINWWYNSKMASKLCWGLKKQSFGRGYLPRVDWSHPWTDEEILKEIGLPEDFLGD